jgi:hypothetical protein
LRADLDTLHILGHGAPGEVILGSQKLDQTALVSIQEQLVSRRKLTQFTDHPNGDNKAPEMSTQAFQMINQNTILDTQICLWSCQTGAGSQGEQFMNTLANITNSTIFATEQLVGNQSKGGTWNLEKSASPRRAAPFSAEARDGFEGVLATYYYDPSADGSSEAGSISNPFTVIPTNFNFAANSLSITAGQVLDIEANQLLAGASIIGGGTLRINVHSNINLDSFNFSKLSFIKD